MKPATADNRWSWLPAMMPGVSALMADKRRQYGAPHVALCWKKGVVERQPGWFFAREGAIAVGTPFDDAVLVEMSAARWAESQAFLAMASPEG
jgi:hypothetical protein